MKVMTNLTFGGYHELPIVAEDKFKPFGENVILFNSARWALCHFLLAKGIKNVAFPSYICGSIVSACVKENIKVRFYHITENFLPSPDFDLQQGEVIVFVNYFGVCDNHVQEILYRFGEDRVIVDFAQSLFSRFPQALASIYSPRKFFGLPDGGILVSRDPIQPPAGEDFSSWMKIEHLIVRKQAGAESGYSAYLAAEESLARDLPLKMSDLSRIILQSIDLAESGARRKENFNILDQHFCQDNELNFMEISPGPLCYPLLLSNSIDRSLFATEGLYIPTYWPDMVSGSLNAFEKKLYSFCLPIPCDQRYSAEEMYKIVDILRKYIF